MVRNFNAMQPLVGVSDSSLRFRKFFCTGWPQAYKKADHEKASLYGMLQLALAVHAQHHQKNIDV